MNTEKKLSELGRKLLLGEITPEQHVEEYNKLIAAESAKRSNGGWQPHENI